MRIIHIIETHIHADFVSGSRKLTARTGATIYGGALDKYGFVLPELQDGDVLEVGALRLRYFTRQVTHRSTSVS